MLDMAGYSQPRAALLRRVPAMWIVCDTVTNNGAARMCFK